ncbi:GDSL-type esterase/lipase family protein [Streptomyces sp. NPDC048514]|uniref:GDSL-type esterase/lipase family protein n=1 Tax=Streptomyces sp. NPDC048514 TaxID=3365564 RepID=UPI00372387CB
MGTLDSPSLPARTLAVMLCAGSLLLTPVAHADAAPAKPTAIVSLGDSFIAGNAGRWRGNSDDPFGDRSGTDRAAVPNGYDVGKVYGDTDGGCFRSDVAEIRSTGIAVDQAINLACSGAESPNIWRASHGGRSWEDEQPQADALASVARTSNVRMVVLSVGGNDLGFGDILQSCITGYMTGGGSCHTAQQAQVQTAFAGAMAAVDKSIKEIRGAMASAGYAFTDYRLVVQSYSSPLPRGGEMRYPENGSRTYEGCPMYNSDLDWARDSLMPRLTDGLRTEARNNSADFLDLSDALQGHEACSKSSRMADATHPPSAASSDWVRYFNTGALQGELKESLHPNAYGQLALGRCLARIWTTGGGTWKCHNTPGQGYDGMYVTNG